MQKRTVTALLLAGAATATSAAEYELDPVIVTASRVAETADETLAPVSVVTREDIERTKPQSMVDLLRLQPGIAITRDGGLSGATSIHMRGTESDHVLILIDGVRVSSSTSALFNWRSLSPAQVERMEIVRGPRATLYGSEAIGGVIQIFTRRADGISAEVERGSHDTFSGNASLGLSGERAQFNLTASTVETDGFDATTVDSGFNNPDDDGFKEKSVNSRLSVDLTDKLKASLSGWYSEGEAEYDQGHTDLESGLINFRADWQVTDSWSQSLQAARTIDQQRTVDYSWNTDSTFDSRRNSYEWQNDLVVASQHMLTAGLSRVEDQGESVDQNTGIAAYDEEVHTNSVFANLGLDFDNHSVQGGMRHDDHSEFGGHTTGQLAWGWGFADDWRAVASYGTAFKAPTLNDLYYTAFGGNPDLDPEESESAEIGLRYTPVPTQRWELNLFRTNIDNLIVNAGDWFNPRYENVDQATIRGLEIVHGGELNRWHWQFNLTLQKARDAKTDDRLIGRPDEQLSVVLGRQIGHGQIQADWLLAGDRVSWSGDELSSYSLLNLSASYPIWKGLSVTARIENVTDEEYQLIDGYNTSERAYFVGLRYQPE